MSEEQLTKLQKLEKRRQQLAKWKLKKATSDAVSEPQTPGESNLINPLEAQSLAVSETPEISETAENPESIGDLKKIERQRKLEEWKWKKQLPNADVLKSGDTEPRTHTQGQSQLRLDAWKKRKRGPESGIILTTVKASPFKNRQNRAKTNVFSLDEEVDDAGSGLRPRFRAPAAPKSNYNRADDILTSREKPLKDELDVFLESLEPAGPAESVNGLKSDDSKAVRESMSDDIVHITDALEDSDFSSEEDEEDKLILAKMKNLSKEKELSIIDHDLVQYEPFTKSFYVELPIVKNLTSEEVKALRLELDGIKVTGKDVPLPIWEWLHLGLSPSVQAIIEDKLGYKKPSSIQAQALPAIMSGRDFMGVAKTGSGKTLAFVLPLLSHVQAQKPLTKGDGPIAILLTPTRELAIQTYTQLAQFTKKMGVPACCCYGGASIEPQIAELKRGVLVVVATPGRLIDLLAANGGRVCNLRRATYIVLDEADRMFDFGFEPQVRKIFLQVRPDRQSILFSATFAKKMESLARAVLQNPVEVVVGGISVVAPEIIQKIEFFDVAADESADSVYRRKFDTLLKVLAEFRGVKKLVFVEKQDSADGLLVKLLAHKIPCVAIHGGKEQIDRKYAIREFSAKNSGVDVLIATSIAARGLDVKGLDLVVNFDPANHIEDHVHRVGRTGRAGNTGDAYTFVTSEQERPIADLVKVLRLSKVAESEIDARLITISNTFLAQVKAGTQKFRFGFGGNGLNKLDETRNSTKLRERKAYDVDPEASINGGPTNANASLAKSSTFPAQSEARFVPDLPEFKVIEGRAEETSGPDKCRFHSRVTINDLPQKARWAVVNADSLQSIIEASSTSITNKGQYYAPKAKIPATIKQGGRDVPAPPKLYLLIEGLTESAVSEANRMIRQKMIEGLEQASDEGLAAPGKYTV